MADGGSEVDTTVPACKAWTSIEAQPSGPVRCPRCKTAVATAAKGENACECGGLEDGCGPAARARAHLGELLRDLEELTAERDAALARATRLETQLGAALMALGDEQAEARRDVVSLCKTAQIELRRLGRAVADACASAHRWRMRATRKTVELQAASKRAAASQAQLVDTALRLNAATRELHSTVRVGVAVILRRPDGRILMGQRRGPYGGGEWSVPGGKLDRGEAVLACAARELEEETGIRCTGLRMAPWGPTHDYGHPTWPDYVTLWASGDVSYLTPVALMEPEKCAEWRWVTREEMPAPLFRCFETLLMSGVDPWRIG